MKSDAFEVLPDVAARDRLGRVTVSQARREELIGKFRESGLSQVKFCRREGVSENTFSGWMRRTTGESRTGEATSSLTRSRHNSDAYTSDTHRHLKSLKRAHAVARPTMTATTPASVEFREVALPDVARSKAGVVLVTVPGGIEVRCEDVDAAVRLIRALREDR
jgi:hypothetical protein